MSTAFFLNPNNKDPERAQSLQRYLVLHSQQESLRRRRPSRRSSTHSSASPSPAPSATSSRRNSPSYASPKLPPSASLSLDSPQVPPILEEDEYSEDEEKLYEINQQIKTTLTTLLNCESVRHDATFRTWVTNKLMDAERDMKQQRRRQGAPDTDLATAVRNRLT